LGETERLLRDAQQPDTCGLPGAGSTSKEQKMTTQQQRLPARQTRRVGRSTLGQADASKSIST